MTGRAYRIGRSTMETPLQSRRRGSATMPEFSYTELLPRGEDADDTIGEYRLLTADGVTIRQSFGRKFLEVDPQVLTLLSRESMRDIAHLLRPAHLRQLRSILDDPEASPNARFVA